LNSDDPDVRRAYVRGARDAYESAIANCDARTVRALEEWLVDLETWTGGERPPPPHEWPLGDD
jgi:hypothetical protein